MKVLLRKNARSEIFHGDTSYEIVKRSACDSRGPLERETEREKGEEGGDGEEAQKEYSAQASLTVKQSISAKTNIPCARCTYMTAGR